MAEVILTYKKGTFHSFPSWEKQTCKQNILFKTNIIVRKDNRPDVNYVAMSSK